jgi:hypothetical protein
MAWSGSKRRAWKGSIRFGSKRGGKEREMEFGNWILDCQSTIRLGLIDVAEKERKKRPRPFRAKSWSGGGSVGWGSSNRSPLHPFDQPNTDKPTAESQIQHKTGARVLGAKKAFHHQAWGFSHVIHGSVLNSQLACIRSRSVTLRHSVQI